MPRALHALLLSLSACTWVSKQDVQDRLPQLDDDKDGYLAADDCDDHSADVHPDADEVWYDGIDENCDEADDFDQDGDHSGYEVDCDDTDANATPGGVEVWYDGVDGDCDGLDDYDEDGDGYVPDEYAGLVTNSVPGSGALPGGDCDDLVASVNPGAADTPYDGTDTDCSGQDDYDQDADGYVPDDYALLPTLYVDGSGALPSGDCDDEDGSIYPDAPDTWYDGIDSDCAGDDDFDQDADGQESEAEIAGPDCDDLDGAIYDGALETVGDGVDSDCDGGEGSFYFNDLNLEPTLDIDTPLSPRLKANSSTLFLSFAVKRASFVELGVESTYYSSAIAFLYDLASLHDSPVADIIPWVSTTTATSATATGGHDLIVTDYGLVGAMGLTNSGSSRTFRLGGYDLGRDTLSGQSYSVSGISDPLTDITIARDEDGGTHFIGCSDDGTLMYLWMDMSECDADGTLACWNPLNQSQILDAPATTCAAEFHTDPSVGTLHLGLDDGYAIAQFNISDPGKYTYDEDSEVTQVSITDTYLPSSLVLVTDADGAMYRVFYDEVSQQILALDEADVEIVIDPSVAESTAVRAVFGPDGRLFVGYLEDSEATLTYGTIADGEFTGATTTLPADFTPRQVDLWVGDATGSGQTDLAVALTGESDIALGFALIAP